MSRKIIIKPHATQDMRSIFGYIGQDSVEAALRFLDAVSQTIGDL